MAKQTITSGASVLWSAIKAMLNANFSELYGEISKSAAAANAFSAGSVGYLHTDDTVILADADAAGTASPMLLMATTSISGGASGTFCRGGLVTVTTHGFAIGAPLYLSTTAGALTATAPSATGDIVRPVAYALDANTLDFRPDSTFVEVA